MTENRTASDKLNVAMGQRMRALRLERDLKIIDLAEKTGLTSSTISQVERALISPSIATLKKICDAMEVPISCLFDGGAPDAVQPPVQVQPAPAPAAGFDMAGYLQSLPPLNLMGASPVVHREERKILSPSEGIRFYLLNPNLSGPIELIYNEYDPGCNTGPALYSHPGSECGLILSGELVVQINEEEYRLKEGDSITFASSEPHLKRNDSDTMCTCIWANSPPWF